MRYQKQNSEKRPIAYRMWSLSSFRVWSVLGVLALGFSLMPACGPGFSTKNRLAIEQEMESETIESALQRLNWREVPDPTELLSSDYLSGILGQSPPQVTDRNIEFDLQIDYNFLFRPLSKVITHVARKACDMIDVPKEGNKNRYRSGELPCGTIVDEQWKQVYTVDVPQYDGEASGFKLKIDPLQLPIYIGRATRQGTYIESTLDNLGDDSLLSSHEFGKDISLRYRPSGDHAEIDVCLNMPGMDITIPQRRVRATAKKKIIWTVSMSSDFDVWPGTVKFDYLRSCATTKISFDPHTLRPKVELQKMEYPRFSEPQLSGMRIEIKDWWLRQVDGLLQIFKVNLRKRLLNSAQREFDDFSEAELENGHWLNRFNQKFLQNKLTERLNDSILNQMQQDGFSTSAISLKDRLKKQCRIMKLLRLDQEDEQEFFDVCEQFFEDIDLKIAPFYQSPELKAAGCYDHFGNIHGSVDESGKAKWWAKKCKFVIRVQARIPDIYMQYAPQIQTLLTSFDQGLKLPEELKLDPSLLPKVLEELERRGLREPTLEDVLRELPHIDLDELVERLASRI